MSSLVHRPVGNRASSGHPRPSARSEKRIPGAVHWTLINAPHFWCEDSSGFLFPRWALRSPRETDHTEADRGNTAKTPFRKCGSSVETEDSGMIEPKLEVPAELRELAEKTIDQAEKAFGMFFDAAGKSMSSVASPGTEISRQALSFTEQNMKAAFDHARKLVHATDLQEAMRIQSEFLKSQFTNAGEHMRQITGGVMSAAKDASKGKF